MRIRFKLPVVGNTDDPVAAVKVFMLHPGARRHLRDMLGGVVRRMRFAFNVGGHHTRGGKRWRPLAPRTLAEKYRLGWPSTILVRTTRLKLANEGRLEPTPRGAKLVLLNKTPYAKFHRRGTRRMPSRPPLELTRQDREYIERKTVAAMNAFLGARR